MLFFIQRGVRATSVHLFFLFTLFVCVASTASAQDYDGKEHLGSFSLGDHLWNSKGEFIRQGRRCATDEVPAAFRKHLDKIDTATTARRMSLAKGRPAAHLTVRGLNQDVTVPVWFHVVVPPGEGNYWRGTGMNKLAEQIAVLSRSYAGATGGLRTDTVFRFALQGVQVVESAAWTQLRMQSAQERAMKTALRQGGATALNVYFVRLEGGYLGWASFPWDYGVDPAMDGVVVELETVPGGYAAPFNEGDTLVHEAGHWLGLYHTFEGGCSSSNDGVTDTGRESVPAFGCPVKRNTCKDKCKDKKLCPKKMLKKELKDPIHNFMDYSDDFCMYELSTGQAVRADNMFYYFREGN